jgi:hypothetical protein
MPDKMFNAPSIKSKTIKVPPVDISRIGQTGNWANISQRIDLGLTNLEKTKDQIDVQEGQDDTNLQRRINKAKAQGNEAKQARLEGRQERIDIRQKARRDRIKKRNTEQQAQTQARQDKKDEKFKARRAGADNKYETNDDTVPVSSAGQIIQKLVGVFKKDTPATLKMSAKQYKDEQKFSKIAKDI